MNTPFVRIVFLGAIAIVLAVFMIQDLRDSEDLRDVPNMASSTSDAVSVTERNLQSGETVAPQVVSSAVKTPPVVSSKSIATGMVAKEFSGITAYLNTHRIATRLNTDEIALRDFLGRRVILINFWSYACVECVSAHRYLNDWWKKYESHGLMLIGVHSPEYTFEKDHVNLERAIAREGISYPILQDSQRTTWGIYGNRTAPHLFLIDIDGKVAFDVSGIENFPMMEKKIQELLNRQYSRAGSSVSASLPPTTGSSVEMISKKSTALYLGASRNDASLGNGVSGKLGVQDIPVVSVEEMRANRIFLSGSWKFFDQYVTNMTQTSSVHLSCSGAPISAVLGASKPVRIKVLFDGKPIGALGGKDVREETIRGEIHSILTVSDPRSYGIVGGSVDGGKHHLELIPESSGLEFYSLLF